MKARIDELTARLERAELSAEEFKETARLSDQARAVTNEQLDEAMKLIKELRDSTPRTTTTTISMRDAGTLRKVQFNDTNWLQWYHPMHQAKLRKEEPSGESSNNFRPGTTHRQPSAQLRACSGHVEVPEAEKLRTHAICTG